MNKQLEEFWKNEELPRLEKYGFDIHGALRQAYFDGYRNGFRDVEKRRKQRSTKKFNPNLMQPFEPILVRPSRKGCWRPSFFGYICEPVPEYPSKNPYIITTNGGIGWPWVPYNEDTKHLLGTYDDPPEYYDFYIDEEG